jgi:hypothetical protein
MLPFGVTIPATVPQRSEIPEGLMNYPVFTAISYPNDHTGFSGWNRLCAISKVSVCLSVCLLACQCKATALHCINRHPNTPISSYTFHFIRKKEVWFENTACVTCVSACDCVIVCNCVLLYVTVLLRVSVCVLCYGVLFYVTVLLFVTVIVCHCVTVGD